MIDFITNNLKTILLVYEIGEGIVFMGVNVFMWWAGRKEDEAEKWEMYEDTGGKSAYALVILLMAVLAAVIWPGLILVIIGVMLYDKMQQKWPELFGDMTEPDEEREE